MFAILLLVGLLLFVVAAIALVKPLPRLWLGTRRAAALAMVLSFASCVAGTVMAPEAEISEETRQERAAQDEGRAAARAEADEGRALARLRELAVANRYIQQVELFEARLVVRSHYEMAWDDKGYVDLVASTVRDVGRVLKQGAVREDPESRAQEVLFVSTVAGTDRLGGEVVMPLGHFLFSADDLRRAQYDNLTSWRVLSLVTDVSLRGPAGRDAAMAWCRDRSRAQEGAGFCRKL